MVIEVSVVGQDVSDDVLGSCDVLRVITCVVTSDVFCVFSGNCVVYGTGVRVVI